MPSSALLEQINESIEKGRMDVDLATTAWAFQEAARRLHKNDIQGAAKHATIGMTWLKRIVAAEPACPFCESKDVELNGDIYCCFDCRHAWAPHG